MTSQDNCIHADFKAVTHYAYRPITALRPRSFEVGVCTDHVAEHLSYGDVVYPSDMQMKPAAVAQVGDFIFYGERSSKVIAAHTYAPGTPEADAAPIARGMVVRAVVTPAGTRYFGHPPGGRYHGAEISKLCADGVSFEDELPTRRRARGDLPKEEFYRAMLTVDGERIPRGPYKDEYQAGRMGRSKGRAYLRENVSVVTVQVQWFDLTAQLWVDVGELITDMTAR